ncbi:MAG: hypothetical protein H7245_04120 [Candidatus Saccharibacteria bacterium]|nr:hypothetical protein [Pseudorhodobacter sp.]
MADTTTDTRITQRIEQVAHLITQPHTNHVIASSEGFSYLVDRDAIQALHDAIAPAFSIIRIVSYLRRQDQFAISHHQEGANPPVKPAALLHGHSPTALPQTSALQHQYLDYETRIGLWGDVFGDAAMILRVYDRATLKNGDSIADILDAVGLPDLPVIDAKDKNVSMGMVETKLGHLLHGIVTDAHIRASVQRRLPMTERMLPARADARAFLAPYIHGNRRLNTRFAISPALDLFSDDFSMFPEQATDQWTESSANTAIRACAEVIEHLASSAATFTAADYAAAARALRNTRPDIAEKFLAAAQGLKPQSDRFKAKMVNRNHSQTDTATKDRRAQKRAARLQKAASPSP